MDLIIQSFNYKINFVVASVFVLITFVQSFKRGNLIFWFSIITAFFIIRIPIICYNNELNLDESQLISGARLLQDDPIFWRSVDGQTIGPLTFYFIIMSKFLDGNITYIGLRILNVLLVIFDLIFFFLTVRIVFSNHVAKFSTFFVFIFLAYNINPEFLHFSSEQLPIFILNLSAYLIAKFHYNKNSGLVYPILSLFFLGSLPFFKIQSVLLMFVLILVTLYCFYTKYGISKSNISKWVLLFISFMIVPLFFLIFILFNNLEMEFWNYYILDNIVYVSANKKFMSLNIILISKEFLVFISSIVLVSLIHYKSIVQYADRKILMICAILLVLSFVTVILPKNEFAHYLNFMIYPLGFWFALALHSIPNLSIFKQVQSLIIILIWQGWQLLMMHSASYYQYLIINRNFKKTPIGEYIGKNTNPNDYIAIWGWDCKLYLETNTLQAVPESHSERCMFETKQQKVHLERYLSYLMKNKPKFIIDVSLKTNGFIPISKFEKINKFINKNYVLDRVNKEHILYRFDKKKSVDR